MDAERWRHVEQILDAVLATERSQWSAVVAAHCRSDPELLQQVHALLSRLGEAQSFLEAPSAGIAEALLADLHEFEARRDEGRLIGAYRLVRELGCGGMSRVFLAERADGQYKQQVAIKLLRPGLDPDVDHSRIRAERQILATLNHPNIARLFDGGTTDGLPYLVLEYIDGQPIHRYCRNASLTIAQRLQLFLTVADAVQYAHDHSVVHRDLKPSNILVTADGTVKLLDFGLAKLLEEGVTADAAPTRTRNRWLTPEYAAPEQVRGGPVTERTDVYQLGAMLYEVLAGRRPFGGRAQSIHDLEMAALELEPEPLPGTLHGDLNAIVFKALRKDPSDRYRSASEFGDDIRRYLAGHPVRARRFTLHYRARRFVDRNRRRVAVAALSVLLAGTFVAAVTIDRVRSYIAGDSAAKPEQVTSNAQALEMYQRALTYEHRLAGASERTGELLAAAKKLYRGAIALDPGFALAHAGLASTLVFEYWYAREPRLLEEIRTEAHAALRLRPQLGEAHFVLSSYWGARGDYTRALAAAERAKEASPRNVMIRVELANLYRGFGRSNDAIAEYREAQELEPRSLGIMDGLASLYERLGRYEDAARTLDRRLSLEPDAYLTMLTKGYLYLRWRGTADTLGAVLRRLPPDWDPKGLATLARVRHAQLQRRPADGLAALGQSRSTVSETGWGYHPHSLLYADLYLAAGDSARARIHYDKARFQLEAAIEERFRDPPSGYEMEDFVRLHIALGRALAGLGRHREAIHEAQRSLAIVPASERADFLPAAMVGAAEIFVQSGEKAPALDLIEHLLRLPAGDAVPVPVLRIEPRWDPLRTDVRFQQLLVRYSPESRQAVGSLKS